MNKSMKELLQYAENLRKRGISQKFIYEIILREFEGTPYLSGGQSVFGSDCSGTVCTAMSFALGFSIRVTADELYRKYFTENADEFYQECFLYAVFFLDGTGKAVHVAGWCGNCFLNESKLEKEECGRFRTEFELKKMYGHLQMKKRGMRI